MVYGNILLSIGQVATEPGKASTIDWHHVFRVFWLNCDIKLLINLWKCLENLFPVDEFFIYSKNEDVNFEYTLFSKATLKINNYSNFSQTFKQLPNNFVGRFEMDNARV